MSLQDVEQDLANEQGSSRVIDLSTRHVRLRTLVWLRWFAILGQSASLLLVHFYLGYKLPLLPCFFVVLSSVILNVVLSVRYPLTKVLGHQEALSYLMFDVLQLASLLYLTGGVQNPFALLFLAPVTISASRLTFQSTIILTVTALISISFLAVYHEPLPWIERGGFELPTVYIIGLWTALLFGVGFTAAYAWKLSSETHHMSEALTATQFVLAREQKLSALGGLAAAAAHELGTPLATIQVVTKELLKEAPKDSMLSEDLELLASQANRCRDILSDLSRNPKDEDAMMSRARLRDLLDELAEPYRDQDILVRYDLARNETPEPELWRQPEVIHGLASLVENAVDFARREVVITCHWTEKDFVLIICDDGRGFMPDVLTRLGEPYISTRSHDGRVVDRTRGQKRTVGGGMGLGFFIAKTLLERTGAVITFGNHDKFTQGSDADLDCGHRVGAVVKLTWQRQDVEAAMLDFGS